MTTPDVHNLSADPADDLMGRFRDLLAAADALEDVALDIQCPGCDPTGEARKQVRFDVLDRYSMTEIDADMLMPRMADLRNVLLGILTPPCGHTHDEQHGG